MFYLAFSFHACIARSFAVFDLGQSDLPPNNYLAKKFSGTGGITHNLWFGGL